MSAAATAQPTALTTDSSSLSSSSIPLPQPTPSPTPPSVFSPSPSSFPSPVAVTVTGPTDGDTQPATSLDTATTIDEQKGVTPNVGVSAKGRLEEKATHGTESKEAPVSSVGSAEAEAQAQSTATQKAGRKRGRKASTETEDPAPLRRRSSRKKHEELADATSMDDASAAASMDASMMTNTQELFPSDSLEPIDTAEPDVEEEESVSMEESATVEVSAEGEVSEEVVTSKKTKRKRKVKVEAVYDETNYTAQALVSDHWVGAHVSAAGGPSNAIVNASLIGARAFALDTRSKRRWVSPPLTSEECVKFKQRMKDFHFIPEQVLPHGSYLMNVGSADDELREKSRQCLLEEVTRCQQLGLHLYNFHPGSTCGVIDKETCMRNIADALNYVHERTAHPPAGQKAVVTVLENMAGSNNVVGNTFAELRYMIDHVKDKSRVGVCIDTCHAFAAGIDLRTKADVERMLKEFDKEVGLKYLRGLHINDSKGDVGCRRDRHESLGKGYIGNECFRSIMNHPSLKHLPLILETPCPDLKQWAAKYGNEVRALYAMQQGALPDQHAKQRESYIEPSDEEIKERKRIKLEKKKARKKKLEEDEEDEEDGEEEEDEDEAPPSSSRRRKPALKRAASAPAATASSSSKRSAVKRKASTQRIEEDEDEDEDENEDEDEEDDEWSSRSKKQNTKHKQPTVTSKKQSQTKSKKPAAAEKGKNTASNPRSGKKKAAKETKEEKPALKRRKSAK